MPELRWTRAAVLPVAAAAVVALLVYWPVFASDDLPGGDLSDTVHQGYPFLHFTMEALRDGRIPHWNPYIYCGIPFYSSFSAPVFYPPRGLLLLLAGPEASVRFTFPLHTFIAGLTAWLFLGSIGVSRGGRLFGALAFSAGAWANTLFYAGHGSKIICWSYLPLLLYSCQRWWQTRRPWFIGLGGICIGMQALSSHPQMVLYSGIAAFLWLLWRFLERPSARGAARALAWLAAAPVLGMAVGAVQLLPGYEFSRSSTRGSDLPPEQAASYSLPPEESLTMAFPHLFGYRHGFPDSQAGGGPVYWGRLGLRLSSEFLGVTVLLTGLWAAFTRRRHGGRALVLVALSGLLISWGGYTPVYDLLYRAAPILRKLRAPHMAAFLTTSGLSLLAGPGFDILSGPEGGRRRWLPFAAASAACLLLALFAEPIVTAMQRGWWEGAGASPGAFPLLSGRRVDLARGDFLRAAFFSAASAGVVLSLARWRLAPMKAAFLLSALAAFELIPVDRDFQVFLPTDSIESLFHEPAGLAPAAGGGRVLPGGNELVPLGIRSVTGYHAARPAVVDRMLESISSGGLPAARATAFTVYMDGRGFATYAEIAASIPADTTPGASPVLPAEPMPRAFMPAGWSPGEGSVPVDPETVTLLESDPGLPRETGGGTASIVIDLPEEVLIETSSEEAALLVLADTWDPGWRAFVDGSETAVIRANGWMRAVRVPQGVHEVRFAYATRGFGTGLALSIAGLVAALATGLPWLRGRRRSGAVGA